jgi:hypothetical protein
MNLQRLYLLFSCIFLFYVSNFEGFRKTLPLKISAGLPFNHNSKVVKVIRCQKNDCKRTVLFSYSLDQSEEPKKSNPILKIGVSIVNLIKVFVKNWILTPLLSLYKFLFGKGVAKENALQSSKPPANKDVYLPFPMKTTVILPELKKDSKIALSSIPITPQTIVLPKISLSPSEVKSPMLVEKENSISNHSSIFRFVNQTSSTSSTTTSTKSIEEEEAAVDPRISRERLYVEMKLKEIESLRQNRLDQQNKEQSKQKFLESLNYSSTRNKSGDENNYTISLGSPQNSSSSSSSSSNKGLLLQPLKELQRLQTVQFSSSSSSSSSSPTSSIATAFAVLNDSLHQVLEEKQEYLRSIYQERKKYWPPLMGETDQDNNSNNNTEGILLNQESTELNYMNHSAMKESNILQPATTQSLPITNSYKKNFIPAAPASSSLHDTNSNNISEELASSIFINDYQFFVNWNISSLSNFQKRQLKQLVSRSGSGSTNSTSSSGDGKVAALEDISSIDVAPRLLSRQVEMTNHSAADKAFFEGQWILLERRFLHPDKQYGSQ